MYSLRTMLLRRILIVIEVNFEWSYMMGNIGIKLTLALLILWLGFIVVFCDIIFTEKSIRNYYIHREVLLGYVVGGTNITDWIWELYKIDNTLNN